ncbi:MAG: hypothetical protein QNK37_32185 [Acidobacteriota bacterium]|nr:hypothetical protein [Acidobacteriota bacterium]
MDNLTLTLTIPQINICLNGLGQQPFKLVSALILKIENESVPQLKKDKDKGIKGLSITLTLTLTLEDVNTILAALGELPFNEVKDVIVDIQNQAAPQLEPPPPQLAKAIKKAEEKADHDRVEPRDI